MSKHRPPGSRERLTRWAAGDQINFGSSAQVDGTGDRRWIGEVPTDRPSAEVMRMGAKRERFVVGAEHDAVARLLQTQAQAARTTEEISGKTCSPGPKASSIGEELVRVVSVVSMRCQVYERPTYEPHTIAVSFASFRRDC
jgi:hypothetical protein